MPEDIEDFCMSDAPWVPFYFGHYQAKTQQLSQGEHGAYMLLMSAYYNGGEPLEASKSSLYCICRAFTKAEQENVHKVLARYFKRMLIDGKDVFVHTRCEEELHKRKMISEARADAGKRGGQKPSNSKAKGKQNGSNCFPNAEAKPEQPLNTHNHNHILSTEVDNNLPSPANGRSTQVWEAYRKSCEARYGVSPPRNAKGNTLLAKLVDEYGSADAEALARFYLTQDDAYYVRNAHSVAVLSSNASALFVRMKSPKAQADVKSIGTTVVKAAVNDQRPHTPYWD